MKNETLKQYLFYEWTKDDGITPYLSEQDFEKLEKQTFSFSNKNGKQVYYFFYQYPKAREDKLILFLPGVGPGHKPYVREIEMLAKNGYRVLTLDYEGCGVSEGDGYTAWYAPASDVLELLDRLSIREEIVVIGHSLGGFTTLNVLEQHREIKKGVVLAGFLATDWLRARFENGVEIDAYERGLFPALSEIDLKSFLNETDDRILFVHSEEDQVVPFSVSTGYVLEHYKKENFSFHIVEGRGHNPNYTDKAIAYMNEAFGTYHALMQDGTLDTFEKKKAFMEKKSAMEMTHQDEEIVQKIIQLIET